MNEEEVEHRIREFFDANYRRLLVEGGAHILTPRALEQARQQVEHYWKRMREVAVCVTETEVRLQLPNRKTPNGRTFVIEGVVDLVREAEKIRMYDIKTHYCGEVHNNIKSYAAQLNVYAYIWRELRGQELHEMGVIAVQLPEALRIAIKAGDTSRIESEMSAWNPLVGIPYKPSSLDEVFAEIASTVDKIEDGEFQPPPLARLRERVAMDASRPVAYATLHCRNCDGRFSCDSYRAYVVGGGRASRKIDLRAYISEAHDDGELDDWIDGNIELDLDRLFPAEAAEPDARRPSTSARQVRRR